MRWQLLQDVPGAAAATATTMGTAANAIMRASHAIPAAESLPKPYTLIAAGDLTVEVRTNRSDVKHCETVPGPPVRSTSARASTFLMQTPAISAGLLRTRADASARNRLQHNTITTITDARVSGG